MKRSELEPESTFFTDGWMGTYAWVARMIDDPPDKWGVGASEAEAIEAWRAMQDLADWSLA